MAVLGRGMQVRTGAGVGSLQFRVVTAPDPGCVRTGLVVAGASVADGQAPGMPGGPPGCGWVGTGHVGWNLPGPDPPYGTVKFGQGDRVMVVLDCRTEPLVRLLVNSRPCLVHHLPASPAGSPPIAIFYPAIALGAGSWVDLEPSAPLPDGWDATPS